MVLIFCAPFPYTCWRLAAAAKQIRCWSLCHYQSMFFVASAIASINCCEMAWCNWPDWYLLACTFSAVLPLKISKNHRCKSSEIRTYSCSVSICTEMVNKIPRLWTVLPWYLTVFWFILNFQKSVISASISKPRKQVIDFHNRSNFVKSAVISGCCTTTRYFQRVSHQKTPKSGLIICKICNYARNLAEQKLRDSRRKSTKLENSYLSLQKTFEKLPMHNKKFRGDSLFSTADQNSLP